MQFADSFYSADTEELIQQLNSYKQHLGDNYKSKAIIVPHAGYIFSGHCAMSAYQRLQPSENIFIFAPSHHCIFDNIALPKYTYFSTPFGSIEVNNRIIKEINEKFPSIIDDTMFDSEHSIEVQLPMLHYVFNPPKQSAAEFVKNLKNMGKKLRIVPILVGRCDYKLISDIITEYWETSSFIISSDLSHFYTHEQCRQIDTYTATIIETGKTDCFVNEQACGLIGIKGLVDFAKKNSFSLIRSQMYNSGDICDDKSKVVGYGSWFLYDSARNNYIKSYYSKYVLKSAQESINACFNEEEYSPVDIPPVLTQYGAAFVTLYKGSALRGCIGSIFPTKPLILDIIDNAKNAAFYDSRFEPLTVEECKNIGISVSILSPIEKIEFKDEKDLMSKIYPNGIIIAERDKRAVYLPEVWEQLPDREIFFSSLKEKAGLNPNYFSRTLEVYKFNTVVINSSDV